ncbi:MAG: hypothetical protein LBP87_10650, partial [Planctomycetaceae bacterium]|nr:hypothetical protein [Planctomycetaceae bacterium]
MKTIRNTLFALSLLFTFVFCYGICFSQTTDNTKQENKTDQDNQPKTYIGLELCSLHDLDKGDRFDFRDKITLYKIGELSNKTPSTLATQMKDGFIVRGIYEDSPVDTIIKLETDDIIVSFNGRRFASLDKYETWLKNNKTPKISLIVYKRSDNYQKNKTVVITPIAEKPENVKTKKTNKNIGYTSLYDSYDQEKQELAERIKNAKTKPLFEGSSVKEIQDAMQVFGKNYISSFDLSEPYEIVGGAIDTQRHIILLDGNKLIGINENIKKIITATDAKDKESVLKKLLQEISIKGVIGVQIENATTVPLFEGSSIKIIQDPQKVFGTRATIPSFYKSDKSESILSATDTIILDEENKLIEIDTMTMDRINEIISLIKNPEDREIVLKWLIRCEISKDR